MSFDAPVWGGRDEGRPLIETEEVAFGDVHVFRHVFRDPKTREVIAVVYRGEPLS